MSASERLRALDSDRRYWPRNSGQRELYEHTIADALPLIADGIRTLERLREWDMLVGYIGADGEHHEATADAPYWRNEIDRALTALAEHLEGGDE